MLFNDENQYVDLKLKKNLKNSGISRQISKDLNRIRGKISAKVSKAPSQNQTSLSVSSAQNIHKVSEYKDSQHDYPVGAYNDPTHAEVSNQIHNLQNDFRTGNFEAKNELLGHLKLQTENIDNE